MYVTAHFKYSGIPPPPNRVSLVTLIMDPSRSQHNYASHSYMQADPAARISSSSSAHYYQGPQHGMPPANASGPYAQQQYYSGRQPQSHPPSHHGTSHSESSLAGKPSPLSCSTEILAFPLSVPGAALRPLPFSTGHSAGAIPQSAFLPPSPHGSPTYTRDHRYAHHTSTSAPSVGHQPYPAYSTPRHSPTSPNTFAAPAHSHASSSAVPYIVPSQSHPQSPMYAQGGSSSPPGGPQERYPCPHCEKTFSRNHDRKRHMETHVPGSSGNNRCRYCGKDYSRADSLKRHVDNGCDQKPR